MPITWLNNLKGAPIPITRHADGHLGLRLPRRRGASARHGTRRHWTRRPYRLGAAAVVMSLGRMTTGAARRWRDAPACGGPALELAETVVADAGEGAARVVVCALVEGGLLGRVRIAEDIAAAAAVVAADEVVEVLFAGWVVADI